MKKRDMLFAAISVQDKPCVIIGGGQVAYRKAKKLVKCGALVSAIAPSFTDELSAMAERGEISVQKRRYERGDIKGAYMAVIATNDTAVNMLALNEAKEQNILINAAFDKRYGNIFFVATKEVDGFTVSAMGKDFSPKESLDFLDEICKKLSTEDL